MPLYDYQCLGCGHEFELRQGLDADPTTICPRCKGSSRRKFNVVPVIYKGSGFYSTDYKKSSFDSTSGNGSSSSTSKEKQDKAESDQKAPSKVEQD